jgi:hypothetical protein
MWDKIKAELVKRSATLGGAWIALRMPFSNEVEYIRYASPSRIPDSLYDLCRPLGEEPPVGYKGKLVGFTKAAIIREQNRATGCE